MGIFGRIAETQSTSEATQGTWADVAQHYIDTHRNHIQSYKPEASERKTIDEERQWLHSLKPVEESSAYKAEASGLFKGVTASDVQGIAKIAIAEGEVAIRRGWEDLLAEIDGRQRSQTIPNLDLVSILSANWSQYLILECLKATDCPMELSIPKEPGEPRERQPHTIRIYGNEIQGIHSPEGSSGSLCHPNGRDFRTSQDKSKWISECADAHVSDTERPLVVYFGDSMGDFEALLEADIGICIRNHPPSSSQLQLLDTFERLGVHIPHILEADISGSNGMVWASDFHEVVAFLQRA